MTVKQKIYIQNRQIEDKIQTNNESDRKTDKKIRSDKNRETKQD